MLRLVETISFTKFNFPEITFTKNNYNDWKTRRNLEKIWATDGIWTHNPPCSSLVGSNLIWGLDFFRVSPCLYIIVFIVSS